MAGTNAGKKKPVVATEKVNKHLTKYNYGLICDWLETDDNVEKIDGAEKKTKVGVRPPVRAKAYQELADYVNEGQRKGSNLEPICGKSLKHRWRNYLIKFRDAKALSVQTGFGLTDADLAIGIETVEEKLDRECPNFKRLDKVLGTRPNMLAWVKFQTGFKNPSTEQQKELPEGLGKFQWKGGEDAHKEELAATTLGEQLLAEEDECGDKDSLQDNTNLSPSQPSPSILFANMDGTAEVQNGTIPSPPIFGEPVAASRTPLSTPIGEVNGEQQHHHVHATGGSIASQPVGDQEKETPEAFQASPLPMHMGDQQRASAQGGEGREQGHEGRAQGVQHRAQAERTNARSATEGGNNGIVQDRVTTPTGPRLSRARSASVGNDQNYPNKKQVGETRHSINAAFADNLEAVNLQREKTNDLRAQKMEHDRQFAEQRLDWERQLSLSNEAVENNKLDWEKKKILEEKKQRIADRKGAREECEANQKLQMKIALISSGIAKSVEDVKGLLDLLE